MDDIFLSDFNVLSSQGNLLDTVKSIKENTTHISSLNIKTDVQSVDVPYFLLKKAIEPKEHSVADALESSVIGIISKLKSQFGEEGLSSTVLLVGTTMIDINLVNSIKNKNGKNKKGFSNSRLIKTNIDNYADQIARNHGLNELTITMNSACTSTANAILDGANLIRASIAERVIVLGIELNSPLISSGFSAMDLLSQNEQKPFSDDRDGLVLGEGIASLLISKKPSKHKLLGGFSNCNSENITGVSESGEEYIQVMKQAMLMADVDKDEISAIKVHATSTPASDLSEMNSLNFFSNKPKLSALKPYIGHTVGVSGVLELCLFLTCIDEGFLPKLPSEKEHIKMNAGLFLCNYFGFGGNNVSILIDSHSK